MNYIKIKTKNQTIKYHSKLSIGSPKFGKNGKNGKGLLLLLNLYYSSFYLR